MSASEGTLGLPSNNATKTQGNEWAFEDFEVDTTRFELRKAGVRIEVQPQVLEVLSYLVANHGRLVSKDELIEHVWPDGFITDATLNSRIMSARKLIDDSGKEQRLIRTVHGRGYRFIGAVTNAVGASPGEPTSATPIPRQGGAKHLVAGQPRRQPVDSLTSFLGRQRELGRLDDLFARPGCRLITIVGPGGVGKTRLAYEAVARQSARGGQAYLISLEAVSAASQLAVAIAADLGITLSGSDAGAELVEQLSGREMLLVLDNMEQLLPDAAPLILAVITSCPGVRLLITSRMVLGLREEWVFSIGGLSLEGNAGEPSDAVQLFLEREAQVHAELPVALDVDDATIEICRLVDGMPLALELAASLSRYLTHEQIAERIARDIDLLRGDLLNVPARHRSMPGLFDESCRYLSDEERQALFSLAVFESSWAPDAAGDVAGAPLTLLATLVDHSLVQSREGRFALHPLMRQFARDRLAHGYESLRRQHAAYYARFLQSRGQDLEGARQVEAIGEIEPEFPNIVAAWQWATDQPDPGLLEAMAHPLFLFLQFRARFLEAGELLEGALRSDATTGDAPLLKAALLVQTAWVGFRTGRYPQAVSALESASEYYSQDKTLPPTGLGTDPRLAFAAVELGGGNYGAAHRLAVASMETALERGDRIGAAFAMWLAGHTRFREVDLDLVDGRMTFLPAAGSEEAVKSAKTFVEDAGRILEELGETWLRSHVESERGTLGLASGDPHQACNHYERAYSLSAAIRDKQGMGSALVYLADLLTELGETARARELQAEIQELYRDLGDIGALSEIERSMGLTALVCGEAGARQLFDQALHHALSMGYVINALGALAGLGRILRRANDGLAADIFAFVAFRTEAGPFARARARASLVELEGQLSADRIRHAQERARTLSLQDIANEALAACDPR